MKTSKFTEEQIAYAASDVLHLHADLAHLATELVVDQVLAGVGQQFIKRDRFQRKHSIPAHFSP